MLPSSIRYGATTLEVIEERAKVIDLRTIDEYIEWARWNCNPKEKCNRLNVTVVIWGWT